MASHRLSRLSNSYLRLRRVRYNQPLIQVRHKSSPRSGVSSGLRLMAYGFGMSSVAAVGVAVYAYHTPEFRRTMEAKIPGFGVFMDSVSTGWKRVEEICTNKWGDLKNMMNRGRSGKVDVSEQPVTRPDKVVPTHSMPGKDETMPIITDSVEKDVKEKESSAVVADSSVAMDTTDTETAKQIEETRSSQFVEQKEEAAISKDSSHFVESSEEVLADTKHEPPVSQPIEEDVTQATEESTPQVVKGSTVEGSGSTPVKEEIRALQDEDKLAKDTSSLSEADARAAAENEVRRVFQDYVMNSDSVVASLRQLACALSAHHQQVLQAIGNPEEGAKMEEIAAGVASAQDAVSDSRRKLKRAMADHVKVSESLADAVSSAVKIGGLDEVVEQVCTRVSEYLNLFSLAEKDVEDAEKSGKNWQDYLHELKKSKEALESELKMSLPNMDSLQEALLHMMRKKVELLEERLSERENQEKQRAADLLIKQEEQHKAAADERMKAALKVKQEEFNELLAQLVCEAEQKFEVSLKEKLVDQASAHSFHLQASLKKQAEELNSAWSEKMSSRLKEVESQHRLQMSSSLARLKGISSMISTIAEAGETARREQSVRVACNALSGVLIAANCDTDPHQKYTISKEVAALRDVTGSDPFISTVLDSIPRQALVEGISSETGLRTRFDHMRRVCRRVALVPEEGGGLGTYLLSFIQSLLTIDMIHSRMVDSHSGDLDPFVILCQAETCLQRGDLDMAVRWMNQLEGEPKRVAKDWLKEACAYLETRQAVILISEYLAASALALVM